ncbi:EAL domain-containing protein [Acidocella sp.]|uniref:EAL domain-containing protein n=1 Tax=Acidocella sp. TaxID=50710 RepID=UPI00261A0297|nr:EAL domain-containing protein [Acidocella sp.]
MTLLLPAAPPLPPPATATRDLRQRTARREITERRRMTLRLRHALQEGGFTLHYQPIISLVTGLAVGAEALIRMHHARRGLIPASQFMPIAERSEVITDIMGWMLDTACRDAAAWPAHFTLSLSLPPGALRSGQLLRQLLESLSRTGLGPERLEMNLTEAMLLDDNEDTIFALRALQGLGARLALTNFGAGYASLSTLKRLRFTTLRLDRSLVQNLTEPAGAAIVRAAIEAAHALGCAVQADGVEHETQYRQLCQLELDAAQGSYFSPPVDATEMAAMFMPAMGGSRSGNLP